MKRIVSTIGLAVAFAALACAGPILPVIGLAIRRRRAF